MDGLWGKCGKIPMLEVTKVCGGVKRRCVAENKTTHDRR